MCYFHRDYNDQKLQNSLDIVPEKKKKEKYIVNSYVLGVHFRHLSTNCAKIRQRLTCKSQPPCLKLLRSLLSSSIPVPYVLEVYTIQLKHSSVSDEAILLILWILVAVQGYQSFNAVEWVFDSRSGRWDFSWSTKINRYNQIFIRVEFIWQEI